MGLKEFAVDGCGLSFVYYYFNGSFNFKELKGKAGEENEKCKWRMSW